VDYEDNYLGNFRNGKMIVYARSIQSQRIQKWTDDISPTSAATVSTDSSRTSNQEWLVRSDTITAKISQQWQNLLYHIDHDKLRITDVLMLTYYLITNTFTAKTPHDQSSMPSQHITNSDSHTYTIYTIHDNTSNTPKNSFNGYTEVTSPEEYVDNLQRVKLPKCTDHDQFTVETVSEEESEDKSDIDCCVDTFPVHTNTKSKEISPKTRSFDKTPLLAQYDHNKENDKFDSRKSAWDNLVFSPLAPIVKSQLESSFTTRFLDREVDAFFNEADSHVASPSEGKFVPATVPFHRKYMIL
jgi:hypothetical protein